MWQITEDNDIIEFKRNYNGYFIEIKLDHGPLSINVFEGTIVSPNNEFIGSASGPTFYGVFDKLMHLTYNYKYV